MEVGADVHVLHHEGDIAGDGVARERPEIDEGEVAARNATSRRKSSGRDRDRLLSLRLSLRRWRRRCGIWAGAGDGVARTAARASGGVVREVGRGMGIGVYALGLSAGF